MSESTNPFPVPDKSPIAPGCIATEQYLDGVYEEIEDYVLTLLEMDPQQRLDELRRYVEMVEHEQKAAWRVAADIVALSLTRDKLLCPDEFNATIAFDAEAIALEEDQAVPYYAQISIIVPPEGEDAYDAFRDMLFDKTEPGFSHIFEAIAAVPNINLKFSFLEATIIPYSQQEHGRESCYIDLEGKITIPHPEFDLTVSNQLPVVSVETLEEFESTDITEEEFALALGDIVLELGAKRGMYIALRARLEQMRVSFRPYPDLELVDCE